MFLGESEEGDRTEQIMIIQNSKLENEVGLPSIKKTKTSKSSSTKYIENIYPNSEKTENK